uniref:Uncharacterized protein n=1 Tax=Panagrolaimus sp. JU765 TaxID=591449 RepID=A0AC34QNR5_9BILA
MNDTGFAVLTKDQLYTMYGPDSPYNNSEILEKLMKVHPSQALELIEKDIHTMARYGHHRRSKRDITLSPIVFFPIIYAAPILSQAVILSPLVFSPIVGFRAGYFITQSSVTVGAESADF